MMLKHSLSNALVADTQRVIGGGNSLQGNSKERIRWIDMAKAIGLLLMILGHSRLLIYEQCREFIYTFHMPLFFLLAGMCYRPRPVAQTIQKDFRSLLIPYVWINVICLLWTFAARIIKDHALDMDEAFMFIRSACTGLGYATETLLPVCPPSWFLIALFYTHLLASVGNKRPIGWLCMVSLVAIPSALLIHKHSIELYTPIGSMLMAFPFFAVGYFGKTLFRRENPLWKVILMASICCVITVILTLVNGRSDVDTMKYGNSPYLFYMGGLVGSMMMMYLSQAICHCVSDRLCSYATEYALGAVLVIGINLNLIRVANSIIEKVLPTLPNPILFACGILGGIAVFVAFLPLIRLCRRYCPSLLGR